MKFLNPAISVTGMHKVSSQSASNRALVSRQSLSGQFKSSAFSDLTFTTATHLDTVNIFTYGGRIRAEGS